MEMDIAVDDNNIARADAATTVVNEKESLLLKKRSLMLRTNKTRHAFAADAIHADAVAPSLSAALTRKEIINGIMSENIMESIVDAFNSSQRKYLWFLFRLVGFICERVPEYAPLFTDERIDNWYHLPNDMLMNIIENLIRHTPCEILNEAYYNGLITADRNLLQIIARTLFLLPNRKCTRMILNAYEREYNTQNCVFFVFFSLLL